VDWIDLAKERVWVRERERDEWWAVVNTVMNLLVPLSVWNILSSGGSISYLVSCLDRFYTRCTVLRMY
jgi:hypothetical protein